MSLSNPLATGGRFLVWGTLCWMVAMAPSTVLANPSFGRIPLIFEQAEGSGTPDDRFFARGPGYHLSLCPTTATLHLTQREQALRKTRRHSALLSGRLQEPSADSETSLAFVWIDANPSAIPSPETCPTRLNYYLGDDPSQWRTGVGTYRRVRYADLYPGIDIVYYGNPARLEYDLVVAPGADPDQIRLRFPEAERVTLSEQGDLVITRGKLQVRQLRPFVFQETATGRVEVNGHYRLIPGEENTVSFGLDRYDRQLPLIIDPVVMNSTYLGGSAWDEAWTIHRDGDGNLYIAGEAASTSFPPSPGLFPTNAGGYADAYVIKTDHTGTNVLWSTYLGGLADDAAIGVDVDLSGNVYLTGVTSSTNFPVTANAVSTNLAGEASWGSYPYDAFVAKLDSAGASLLYSTYLGGVYEDQGILVKVDQDQTVYIIGTSQSPDFPVTSGTTNRGGNDAFISKSKLDGPNPFYTVTFGGVANDYAQDIALTADGNLLVVGQTASWDFPITNAWQTNFAGGSYDCFLTKLEETDASPIFSTFLGGSGRDEAFALAQNTNGAICLTGLTDSTDFPLASALFTNNAGGQDVFITSFNPQASEILYSTYLGGVANDSGWDIAVDGAGRIHVAGTAGSSNFPVTNAVQYLYAGGDDGFALMLNASGSALEYSTYLGGAGDDNVRFMAVDPDGVTYVIGGTDSSDFPILPDTNVFQAIYGGGSRDGFMAKLFVEEARLESQETAPGQLTLSWSQNLAGYNPVMVDSLVASNDWSTLTNLPLTIGNRKTVTVSNLVGQAYYQLEKTD